MGNQQQNLLKLAAEAIKSLQLKNTVLEDKYEKLSSATDLAFSLLDQGKLAAEDIELYVKEACNKNQEELNIIKQASIFKDESLNTFSVSVNNEINEDEADLIGFLLNN